MGDIRSADYLTAREQTMIAPKQHPPEKTDLRQQSIIDQFNRVRSQSALLCEPLIVDDYSLQAMPETSPVKWHIAHTSWFFETFVLKNYQRNYACFNSAFEYLFNSYYNGVGQQYPRHKRNLLSRPSVEDVFLYRQHVTNAMLDLMHQNHFQTQTDAWNLIELGCHHEQQHQELFFTDLKYCWFQNPLYPAYCQSPLSPTDCLPPIQWQPFTSGLFTVGHDQGDTFCFDNEQPAHSVYLHAFLIADRLVSNEEYLAFMHDDGYQRPELWLSDGWAEIQQAKTRQKPLCPLYWIQQGQQWMEYSLHGLKPLDSHAPVCHLSAYEADAYARWAGCRLPTEQEWEVTVQSRTGDGIANGQFLQPTVYHPQPATPSANNPIIGRLWQWTSSAYSPYPGFSPAGGAVGEYNGKFMANQLVLRGGSCVTSIDHYRHSYRNFFYARDQWQFSGIRLAKQID